MADVSNITLNGTNYTIKDSSFRRYDTVAAMVADTKLSAGMYAQTGGYYSLNDGGGALYSIRAITSSDTISSSVDYVTSSDGLILLSNGLCASINGKYLPVNIKTFGAKGDGSTDDASAINNAISYASSGGLAIYVPKGIFAVTSRITISTEGFSVFGDGGYSILKMINTTASILLFSNTNKVSIRNIRLMGLTDGTITGGNLLQFTSTMYAEIDNVILEYCWNALTIVNGAGFRISNVMIHDAYIGMYFDTTNDHYCSNTFITHCTYGIHMTDTFVEAIQFVNSTCLANSYNLYANASSSGSHPRYCKFTNVYFDSATLSNVYLIYTDCFDFVNCWFSSRFVSSGQNASVVLKNSVFTKFIGCDFYNNYQDPDDTSTMESKSIIISCDDIGGRSATGTVITSCTFNKFGKYAIYLNTGANGAVITNNIFRKPTTDTESVQALFMNGSPYDSNASVIAKNNLYGTGLTSFSAGTRPGVISDNYTEY